MSCQGSFTLSAGNGEYTLSYLIEHFKIMIFVIFICIQIYPLISFYICGCKTWQSDFSLFLLLSPVRSSVARNGGVKCSLKHQSDLCKCNRCTSAAQDEAIVSNLFSQTGSVLLAGCVTMWLNTVTPSINPNNHLTIHLSPQSFQFSYKQWSFIDLVSCTLVGHINFRKWKIHIFSKNGNVWVSSFC